MILFLGHWQINSRSHSHIYSLVTVSVKPRMSGECNFCINVVTDNQCYRAKSAEKVVDELETLAKRYGVNHFKIIDDNFFVLKESKEDMRINYR